MMTKLDPKKLRSVAELARFCVKHPDLLDDKLLPQTLGIAIRKLHDFGECRLGRGKYLGHPYWSRQARALLRKNSNDVKGIEFLLAHEHVIPIGLVVKRLLTLPKNTTLEAFEIEIRKLSLVAIIRRDQDDALKRVKINLAPDDEWIYTDPWWRYREAKILPFIIDDNGRKLRSQPDQY